MNKEAFKEDYELNLLSIAKLSEKYNMCPSSINKLIKEMGLYRDKKAVKSLSNKMAKGKFFEDLKKTVTKEMLEKYYIEENHGYYETQKHFNISDWTFNHLLDEYEIQKDRKITGKQSVKTREEKAGGKHLYNKQLNEKRKKTIVEKYGSLDVYYDQVRKQAEKTNLERYGCKDKVTADLITKHSRKYMEVWSSKEASIEYLKSFPERPTVNDLMLMLNCTINNVYLWVEKFNLGAYIKIQKSSYEQEIISFIQELGFEVIRNDRKVLNGNELDIYIPKKDVAIEINGNFWHSDKYLPKTYHYRKSKACEEKGIRLIHVYQYQWDNPIKREILKSIIRNALGINTRKIYARKCELRELKKEDVKEFSEQNSLHGHRNASIYLGLFYEDELIEIMSFGKAFFSRDPSIDYECIRSITKLNTSVVGGMNKLFTYFIAKYSPKKILYYVDYNTHIGNSMERLGFKFISYSRYGTINIANSREVCEKYGQVFNRKPNINKEIQEYCKAGKILTIYDAGVKKYIWNA